MSTPILQKWHSLLALPRKTNLTWHRSRLLEELAERRSAITPLTRLSETADILFTVSRARHDGFALQFRAPWSRTYNGFAKFYMLGKFSSRWGFYRVAAYCVGKRDWRGVREVVNPRKGGKVQEVAGRHGIESEGFKRVCRRLLWVLPVFP
ncbi:hypothetical protein BJY00DRAFT_317362 [Aspergillus carlsbadensis]|nr:hypothetical protein BJY00DRAFT_317362 [Aspergillus carlsbadensis]